MKEILLFSSGMDSFIAWFYLKKPQCLYVDLGQRYGYMEEAQVDEFSRRLGVPLIKMKCDTIGPTFERPDAHIPLRNMLLATLGAMFAETVYLVCQAGEREIPDRSTHFFLHAGTALSTAAGEARRVDPVFWDMTKVDMVRWFLDQGHPRDLLLETFSCFETENGTPCAACAACFRRAQAFLLNEIEEPWYDDLRVWEGLVAYRERLNSGQYKGKRAEEMNHALTILGH